VLCSTIHAIIFRLATTGSVDIKKKRILSLELTSEEAHDGKILKKLVDIASENNTLKGSQTDRTWSEESSYEEYLSVRSLASLFVLSLSPCKKNIDLIISIDFFTRKLFGFVRDIIWRRIYS
jgi:hypothetical protein